jgi:hypothetical protein
MVHASGEGKSYFFGFAGRRCKSCRCASAVAQQQSSEMNTLAGLFPGDELPAVRVRAGAEANGLERPFARPLPAIETTTTISEGAELKFEHRAPSGQWTLKNLASTQWWRTELLTCSETQVKPACPKRPRRFDRNPAGFSRAVVQLEQRTFTLGSNVPCEGSLGFNVTAQ